MREARSASRRSPGPRRGRELGGGAVKAIIGLVFLALIIHTAYVFVPLYVAVYDFDSQVEKEANYGADKTNDTIIKSLVQYAGEKGLPVKRENLRIDRTQSKLTITANYTVPVRTLVYTHEWAVTVEKSAVLF